MTTTVLDRFRQGAVIDSHPIILVVVFYLFVLAIGTFGGDGVNLAVASIANLAFSALGIFAVIMPYLIWKKYQLGVTSMLRFWREDEVLERRWTQLMQAVPMLFAWSLLLPAFSLAKHRVGIAMPYNWDASLLALDIRIHGTDAWRLLQPLLGFPFVTFLLSIAYHVWMVMLYVMIPLFCVLVHERKLRQQVLLSYLLCWIILGSIASNMFASVGPCFLQDYTGDAHFRPLMDYLVTADHSFPVLVLDMQSALLAWQRSGSEQLGQGISAMPSMHVSIAFLFFLAARHLAPALKWSFGIFFIIILVSSVHLGYHYAVDGYAAIIGTLVIWYLCGWWANRCEQSRILKAE